MIERLYQVSREYLQFAAKVMSLATVIFGLTSTIGAWPSLFSWICAILLLAFVAETFARLQVRAKRTPWWLNASRFLSPAWLALSIVLMLVSAKAIYDPPLISPVEFVQITEPQDGGKLSFRTEVAGRVSRSVHYLIVVVCPANGAECVVQRRPFIAADGTWRGEVYLGALNSGPQAFVIRAIADPKMHLNEGTMISAWPEAKAVSKPVVVMRE